jgi:hypothetical protein
MRGEEKKIEAQSSRDTTLAWQIANLSRAEKIPPLKRLLDGGKESVSPEEGFKRLEAMLDARKKAKT